MMKLVSSQFIQSFLTITIVVLNNYCQATCKSSVPNIASVSYTFLNNLIDPVKYLIPTFDNNTVPKFTTIVQEYESGLDNEDIHLNITQLLSKYGYPTEQHEVETSDGYLLTMFRIPGKGSTVFLMHGILCSSDDFVTTGPNRGLAYLLADAGYDVWLGNARGNVHSRNHVRLSPDCAEFWDFSWDEIGRYDLPAMIDYILKVSQKTQLVYVGYSQGTSVFFVMASEKPEYNDKISVMIALSPVAFFEYSGGPLFRIVSSVSKIVDVIAQTIGLYEFAPRNPITDLITSVSCGSPSSATVFCNNIAFLIFGFDYAQINATNLPVFYGHFPAGCATKQLLHYAQLFFTTHFRRIDRGPISNLMKYGTMAPPEYPLKKVTTKVVIFNADNDFFNEKPDLERLINKLPNVVDIYQVPFALFAHLDFMHARDVKHLVNDKVLEFINRYK